MTVTAVLQFVTDLVKSWDERRALCLGRLVYALMRGGRLGVAEIGRHIPTSTTDKHHIKAVDRFLGNEKLDLYIVWSALLRLAAYKHDRLDVLLDWTDLGDGFEVLKATVSYGGRSQPVAWVTTKKGHYGRSRNLFETNFCKAIRAQLPAGVELVIIADRGFARASLFRALTKAGIHFIIRARKDVHLIHGRGTGALENRSIARGQIRDLVDARYGKDAHVLVRCVITFGHGTKRNKPKRPWYLITDLGPESRMAATVVDAYRLRMRIEHNFRDHKSMRFGFQLRSVHLTTCDRYDRLLAIAAVAMLLLVNLGAYVEKLGLHRGFKANTDPKRTHSLLRLGLNYISRLRLRMPRWRLFTAAFAGALDGAT
jgi:Transposase DDE domain